MSRHCMCAVGIKRLDDSERVVTRCSDAGENTRCCSLSIGVLVFLLKRDLSRMNRAARSSTTTDDKVQGKRFPEEAEREGHSGRSAFEDQTRTS